MKPVQVLENLLASARVRKVKSGYMYLVSEELLPEVYAGIKAKEYKLKGGNIYVLYGEDGMEVYVPVEDGAPDDSNLISVGGGSEEIVEVLDNIATEAGRKETGDPSYESTFEDLFSDMLEILIRLESQGPFATKQYVLDTVNTVVVNFAPRVHTHAIGQVTGLQGELDGKANSSHTHSIADISGLEARLEAIESRLDELEGEGGG